MRWLILCLFVSMAAGACWASDLIYERSFIWLPAGSDNVCALVDSLDHWPDGVILYSDSDIRVVVGMRGNASDASAAQTAVDSLINPAYGLLTVVPGEGHVFHGQVEWLLSPARTDTVFVDVYNRPQGFRWR